MTTENHMSQEHAPLQVVYMYLYNDQHERKQPPIEIRLKDGVADLSGVAAYDEDLAETWAKDGVQNLGLPVFPKDGVSFLVALSKLSRGYEYDIRQELI